MLGFFIETASEKGFAALYDEAARPLAYVRFLSADGALQQMERLFQEASVDPSSLSYVGAGFGPGSFTGIRIGVMIARAFAFALKIPLVGLSSLSLYSEDLPVLVDARTGGVWGQFPGEEPALMAPEQAIRGFQTLLTPNSRTLKPKLEKAGFKGELIESEPNAILIGKCLLEALKRDKKEIPEILYLRETFI